jgi:hypothetical protein
MISEIILLWIVLVVPFAILSLLSFNRSSMFFKCALISIGIYVIFFFFFGFLTQLAKFLPAYLILIPMSLQYLSDEYTGNSFSEKFLTSEQEA